MSGILTRSRHAVLGTVFIALLFGIVWGVVVLYRGDLRDTINVTMVTDRAGLTMAAGAPVKMRGVEIGRVGEVRATDDGAEIELEIDTDKVEMVPADVTAQIIPPTAFGAKYVQLTAPTQAAASEADAGTADDDDDEEIRPVAVTDPIDDGATITADAVTVEVNEAFTNLTEVLDAARPSEVNNALTAAAEALDGRGEQLGELVVQLDTYLRSFNPSLPSLEEDLNRAEPVIAGYDAALPDLVTVLEQATITGETITSQQTQLRAFSLSLTSFADTTQPIVEQNAESLQTTLSLLAPVTDLLAEYSPELSCVVLGAEYGNEAAEKVVGGTNPGISTYTRLQPGDEPYTYPDDLPIVAESRGPNCYGLPYVTPEEAAQLPTDLDVGTDPYAGGEQSATENLGETLIGLVDGLIPVSPERKRFVLDAIKLAAFLSVAALMTAYLVIVTGDVRGGERETYAAEFDNISGLQVGDQVRVASVVSGRVTEIAVQPDAAVLVTFELEQDIDLPANATATVKYRNLIGDRYVELARPAGETAAPLEAGDTLPVAQTASALDLDTLLAGFRPLFVGLNPTQINQLATQLVQVLQGQQSSIGSLLQTVASVTTTLGDRQDLITSVITNLNTALATFDDRSDTLDTLIVALSDLVVGLDGDDTTVLDAADELDGLAVDATDLIEQARGGITADLEAAGQLATELNAQSDTLDVVLNRLPEHYDLVQQSASYGNFFNFFLCGIRVQLLDINGEPVQTPWINSDVERCQ